MDSSSLALSPATDILAPRLSAPVSAPPAPEKSVPDQLPLSDEIGATDAVSALAATDYKLEEEITPRQRVKALVEKTLAARPQTDAKLLEDAFAFASEKHAPQTRKSGEPYIEHPIAVAGILAELGMDDVTIAAGLLHDVPEDCNVSYEEMQERFGADVAHLVEGVTKLKHIRFDTKADKQAGNLRKLFLAMAGDVRVIIIKLADRLHNMRTLDPFEDQKRITISEETLYIFAPIAHRLGIWRVKWELEDRAFKYLEPDVYKQIYSLVQRKRDERTAQVQSAISSLQERLAAEGIEAEVVGRPKHFYSIYQKMVKQGLKFDAIHDLIALRVITPSVPDCYHALGIVHALWMQVPEMFFDYIAKPKPNNYQSLHTKVLDDSGEILEVQIRTREMHRDAEFGIAAHWRYKADQGERATEKAFSDRLRWLRPVLEIQQETSTDTQGYLDSLRMDLSAEQVFCFTPHGDVIYLPLGSTPIDFAYRVHSEIGNKCTGAKVNGRQVPLSHKLHNSDICEIMTSRSSKGPKRGWLDFVVTPHAKTRIKAFLRKQNFDENYRHGTQRLQKIARTERVKLPNLVDFAPMQKLAKALGQKSAAELIAAVGYGEFSPEHIFNRLKPDLVSEPKKEEADGLSSAAAKLLATRPKSALDLEAEAVSSSGSDMAFGTPGAKQSAREIEISPTKTDGISHTLMRCCAPIPGDKIKGYITRGRGISVHRATCANLRNYEQREPNRVVPAVWAQDAEKTYQALIAVESNDRNGLLADITTLIAERKININAVNTYPLKHGRARLNLAVTINSREDLEDVMTALRQVQGVTDVHRV